MTVRVAPKAPVDAPVHAPVDAPVHAPVQRGDGDRAFGQVDPVGHAHGAGMVPPTRTCVRYFASALDSLDEILTERGSGEACAS